MVALDFVNNTWLINQFHPKTRSHKNLELVLIVNALFP